MLGEGVGNGGFDGEGVVGRWWVALGQKRLQRDHAAVGKLELFNGVAVVAIHGIESDRIAGGNRELHHPYARSENGLACDDLAGLNAGTKHNSIAAASVADQILPITLIEDIAVVAISSAQRVGAGASIEGVVPTKGQQGVIASTADEHIRISTAQ